MGKKGLTKGYWQMNKMLAENGMAGLHKRQTRALQEGEVSNVYPQDDAAWTWE